MKNSLSQPDVRSEILLKWYNIYKRDLPWRKTRDPYLIWVSEIILQQTRVAQGLSYYLRFTEEFPDVKSLAEADPEKVMKLWQGLGYYNRAINMIAASKMVMDAFNGSFPDSYVDLIQLKGIGKYTAAAIASISVNEPVAVVDGNVIRVISRIFGVDNNNQKEFDSSIQNLANELLSKEKPGDHNQAIMEFGALQCVPSNPLCSECIFKKSCYAFQSDKVASLPPKKIQTVKKTRYFHFLVISDKQKIYIQKRGKNDIWPNLYQFPMVEMKSISNKSTIFKEFEELLSRANKKNTIKESNDSFRHLLTHQIIIGKFYSLKLNNLENLKDSKFVIINRNELKKLAFPKPLSLFLEKFPVD